MTDVIKEKDATDFVTPVRRLVADRLEKPAPLPAPGGRVEQLMPGKMLRTRLAARLASGGCSRVNLSSLKCACAATETTHTAGLCHDDVIDNGLIRRATATLWKATTPSGAVLVGDMLLSHAV